MIGMLLMIIIVGILVLAVGVDLAFVAAAAVALKEGNRGRSVPRKTGPNKQEETTNV